MKNACLLILCLVVFPNGAQPPMRSAMNQQNVTTQPKAAGQENDMMASDDMVEKSFAILLFCATVFGAVVFVSEWR